ncbi:Ribosomal RNA processing protein 1-like protein [Smittium mucronatum]|uniref:Ribosomal RNA processing protein 1-like protein n=1 Tax=Smittium mucronatum TaxID=133383 RepID=A0A1R0GNC4_9FUNG|nr:Ribosomal RNA processing protein 1-like protein [Smittium mucronatum]
MRIWKALYYCFWLSDKPLVQQELADNLGRIPLSVGYNTAFLYIQSFWKTILREWNQIDRHSPNNPKYPDGIRSHVSDILMDEIIRYYTEFQDSITDIDLALESVIEPFLQFLYTTPNPRLFSSFKRDIADYPFVEYNQDPEDPEDSQLDPLLISMGNYFLFSFKKVTEDPSLDPFKAETLQSICDKYSNTFPSLSEMECISSETESSDTQASSSNSEPKGTLTLEKAFVPHKIIKHSSEPILDLASDKTEETSMLSSSNSKKINKNHVDTPQSSSSISSNEDSEIKITPKGSKHKKSKKSPKKSPVVEGVSTDTVTNELVSNPPPSKQELVTLQSVASISVNKSKRKFSSDSDTNQSPLNSTNSSSSVSKSERKVKKTKRDHEFSVSPQNSISSFSGSSTKLSSEEGTSTPTEKKFTWALERNSTKRFQKKVPISPMVQEIDFSITPKRSALKKYSSYDSKDSDITPSKKVKSPKNKANSMILANLSSN